MGKSKNNQNTLVSVGAFSFLFSIMPIWYFFIISLASIEWPVSSNDSVASLNRLLFSCTSLRVSSPPGCWLYNFDYLILVGFWCWILYLVQKLGDIINVVMDWQEGAIRILGDMLEQLLLTKYLGVWIGAHSCASSIQQRIF